MVYSASSISPMPGIRFKEDVTLFEVFDGPTGDFLCTRFTYFDSSSYVWIGQIADVRKHDLTVHDLNLALEKIPDEQAYPDAPKQVTLANSTDSATCFVKRPQVHCLLNKHQAPLVPRMMLDEVNTLEILRKHPHQNIVLYHGCTIERGRLTGIVLQRQPKILDHRFLEDAAGFDMSVFESQLRAAIQHIHELGFAHNDLNPSNIALNERDEPIVIDWGSCKKFGAELISGGTAEWIDEDFDVSKKVSTGCKKRS